MENRLWKENISNLKKSIWAYTICGLLSLLFGFIEAAVNPVGLSDLFALANGDVSAFAPSVWSTLSTVCSVLVIVGYVFFFLSVSKFAKMQGDAADTAAAGKLRTAYILFLISVIVVFIPLLGWLAALVLLIVAYVFMLQSYGALSRSAVLQPQARDGAALLRRCTIWTIVAELVAIIPLIGALAAFIINLIVFFKVLKGWTMIADGAPVLPDEGMETAG